MIVKPPGYTIAVDVAYSDDKPMNYRTMKAAGVDMVAFKAGQRYWKDPLRLRHLLGAMEADMILAMYWYLAPDYDSGNQARTFEQVWKEVEKAGGKLRFIAPDLEQEKGYIKKVVNGKIKQKYELMSSGLINNSAWAFTEYIKKWAPCEIMQYGQDILSE